MERGLPADVEPDSLQLAILDSAGVNADEGGHLSDQLASFGHSDSSMYILQFAVTWSHCILILKPLCHYSSYYYIYIYIYIYI